MPRLAFSLREIARDVGIATPSIYRHFPSKESLIRTAVGMGYDELVTAMRQAREAATGDAFTALGEQAVAYGMFLFERPGLTRLLFATTPRIGARGGRPRPSRHGARTVGGRRRAVPGRGRQVPVGRGRGGRTSGPRCTAGSRCPWWAPVTRRATGSPPRWPAMSGACAGSRSAPLSEPRPGCAPARSSRLFGCAAYTTSCPAVAEEAASRTRSARSSTST
ncbi:TetR/AcrR family transcriptional regulator [Pseudonocardia sp. NPDC049154]|uniref:TetR/AcrR family transcriptional regulator n=1 Tax=Pseudonocardia sp. NPDC049154 TaxID=3155501 RepID=UPI003400ACAF